MEAENKKKEEEIVHFAVDIILFFSTNLVHFSAL